MSPNKPAGLPCAASSASFWHSEPNQFLYGHRTTEDLPPTADIVVVGSGITGASIARYLAADPRAANMSIVMLEAREICWGATGRNGGHCQPLLFDRTPDVAAFEMENVHSVQSYIEEHDVPCAWRSVTGCRLFGSTASFDATKAKIKKLAAANPELGARVTLIEAGDAKTMKKHRVNPSAKGVTLTQGAGQLWPYKYVAFIVEKLVREGRLNVQTNTPVTKIEAIDNDNGTATSTGSAYTQRLTTPRGSMTARHIILATNGYTSHLLHSFSDLIVPVRCEMSALHPPVGSERLPDSYGMVGFDGRNPHHDDYLVQLPFYDSPNGDGTRRGGHLMFGGGRNLAMYDCIGETDDDIVDPGEADHLRRALLRYLDLGGETEGLKELRASHQWTGIKGMSRDDMPWVGKVPKQKLSRSKIRGDAFEEGLWLCGGYSGHGMPNASLCGKAVVDMVLAEEEGGKSYDAVCDELVSSGGLPQLYVLTKERLRAARDLPSVADQDVAVPVSHGENVASTVAEKEGEKSRCQVM